MAFFANVQDASFKLKGLAVELLDAALGILEKDRTERTKVDEEATKLYEKVVARTAEAREKLFPDTPATPTVPLALPLEAYTGTYRNVGYGRIKFTVMLDDDGKDCLKGDLMDRTWKIILILHPVNAEHCLVSRSSANNTVKPLLKAEGMVRTDGNVKSWGVAMEPAMPDILTWFARQED